MNFFMNLNGMWWELFDAKGQLIKLCLVSENDLNQAIQFFTEYASRFSDEPVIREFEELFRQG